MEGSGKLITVTKAESKDPKWITAELRIAGRLLYDASIRPGDSVAVEVVGDGELRVGRW